MRHQMHLDLPPDRLLRNQRYWRRRTVSNKLLKYQMHGNYKHRANLVWVGATDPEVNKNNDCKIK